MSLTTKFVGSFILAGLILLYSCNGSMHNRSGVEKAMKYYDHLILKLDADSISMLYTPDGNLGDIAMGRDSIKRFLSSFKNVRVLSQVSATRSIDIIRDTAIQNGTYTQTDIVSGKDTIKVRGEYTTRWEWIRKDGWHIKRMTTRPAN